MDFPNGARVLLSAEGHKTFPYAKKREGIVSGQSNVPGCRRVLWDGAKQPNRIHIDYLQLLI